MRHITHKGRALIKQFEGFSPVEYVCAAGYRTIGYGHVIRHGEIFDGLLSEREASVILLRDVSIAERVVLRYINVPLRNGQFDALVSFTFNLGAGALQRSTLRRKVNAHAHEEAANEFHRWVYAGGRKLSGLARRRAAEAKRYNHAE